MRASRERQRREQEREGGRKELQKGVGRAVRHRAEANDNPGFNLRRRL